MFLIDSSETFRPMQTLKVNRLAKFLPIPIWTELIEGVEVPSSWRANDPKHYKASALKGGKSHG
jgi:hypothetical protein